MKIFKFHWDCGRMGDVLATFAATQEEVDAAIGKKVYFGEILGKHSEIYGTLEKKDLTVLTVILEQTGTPELLGPLGIREQTARSKETPGIKEIPVLVQLAIQVQLVLRVIKVIRG